jgi:hypothetical protein
MRKGNIFKDRLPRANLSKITQAVQRPRKPLHNLMIHVQEFLNAVVKAQSIHPTFPIPESVSNVKTFWPLVISHGGCKNNGRMITNIRSNRKITGVTAAAKRSILHSCIHRKYGGKTA